VYPRAVAGSNLLTILARALAHSLQDFSTMKTKTNVKAGATRPAVRAVPTITKSAKKTT
jgi:hypothetical protein